MYHTCCFCKKYSISREDITVIQMPKTVSEQASVSVSSLVLQDGPWDEADLGQRQLRALDSGYQNDVTVVVGNEGFQCHSLMLSFVSPKFAVMLHSKELYLPHISPRYFRLLLEIIYSGQTTQLQDVDTLLNVGQTAHELQVHTAVVFCATRLGESVDVINVYKILDFARLVNDMKLHETCVKVIRLYAGTLLQTEEFLQVKRETLITILQQNELYDVSELKLFLACSRWATTNCERNPRSAIGPALKLIRFRAISAEDFAEYVCPTKLLLDKEERDIMRCFITNKDFMPPGFSKDAHQRCEQLQLGPEEEINVQLTGGWGYKSASEIKPMKISLNKEAYILGVKLDADKRDGKCFEENVEVLLKRDSEVLASATFQGKIKQRISLRFERPCAISANTVYELHVNYAELDYQHECWMYEKQSQWSESTDLELRVLETTWSTIDHIIVAVKIENQKNHSLEFEH